jgi:flagellar hook-length control protein FliK
MKIDQVNPTARDSGLPQGDAAANANTPGGPAFSAALDQAVTQFTTAKPASDGKPDATPNAAKDATTTDDAAPSGDPLSAALVALLAGIVAPLQPQPMAPALSSTATASGAAVDEVTAAGATSPGSASKLAAAQAMLLAQTATLPDAPTSSAVTPLAPDTNAVTPGNAATPSAAAAVVGPNPAQASLAANPAAGAQAEAASLAALAPTLGRMAPRANATPFAARDSQIRPSTTKPTTETAASPAGEGQPQAQPQPAAAVASTGTEQASHEEKVPEIEAHAPAAAKGGEPFALSPDASVAHVQAPARPAEPAPPSRLEAYHPVEQIAISLKSAAHDGVDRITVELKPASLGAVEVRLDFATDGRVSATIVADRADTLSLLKSDAGGLEQALRDAGLRADSGSLSFNLRGGESQPDPRQFQQASTPDTGSDRFALDGADEAPAASGSRAPRSHAGLLDIRI